MADTKTTALAALASPAYNDLCYTVDVSDTSGGASGTSKKASWRDIAMYAFNSGNNNGVVIGYLAGESVSDQIAIGFFAGSQTGKTDRSQQVNIGRHAGYDSEGSNAICIGHAAGQYASASSSAAVMVGAYAGRNTSQVALSYRFSAVMVGAYAGEKAKSAQTSTLVGYGACKNSTGSGGHTCVGAVVIGYDSASGTVSAGDSVVIGRDAGKSAATLTNSVYVGALAGGTNGGSNNVCIGYKAGETLAANSVLVIETNATYAPNGVNGLIYGEFVTRLLRFGADTVKLKKDLILEADQTPASATDTGSKGMVRWDASYIYICIATNTWKRVATATW